MPVTIAKEKMRWQFHSLGNPSVKSSKLIQSAEPNIWICAIISRTEISLGSWYKAKPIHLDFVLKIEIAVGPLLHPLLYKYILKQINEKLQNGQKVSSRLKNLHNGL